MQPTCYLTLVFCLFRLLLTACAEEVHAAVWPGINEHDAFGPLHPVPENSQPAASHGSGSAQSGAQSEHVSVVASIGSIDARAALANYLAAPAAAAALDPPVDNEQYNAEPAPAADGPGDELEEGPVVLEEEAALQQQQVDEEQLGIPIAGMHGAAHIEGDGIARGAAGGQRRTTALFRDNLEDRKSVV